MKKALTLSIIVSLFAIAAYLFKPSQKDCISKASQEFRNKIAYTIEMTPAGVDKSLLAQTLEKNFLQELQVVDHFLYRNIFQNSGSRKNKIGWAAFGWINVEIK